MTTEKTTDTQAEAAKAPANPGKAAAPKHIANRPRPVSDLVPNLTNGIFGKTNMLFGKMLAEWAHIAGDEIASQTTPLELKFSRIGSGKSAKDGKTVKTDKTPPKATLHLAVQPAYALELSYQKNLLIERLNMFFGYGAIKDIKLIQNSEIMNNKVIKKAKIRPLTLQEQQKIDRLVGEIQENDLQTALKNLGKAIVSRQDKGS